jgi:hypothetical protein
LFFAPQKVGLKTTMTFSVHAACVLLLCLSTGSAVMSGISCNGGEVMNGTNFEGSNIDSIPLHPKDDASAMATCGKLCCDKPKCIAWVLAIHGQPAQAAETARVG